MPRSRMTSLTPAVSARRLMLASVAATVAAVLAASAARASEPARCQGTITGTAAPDGLVVPEGATCTIDPGADVKVSGSVDVKPRGTLELVRRNGVRGTLSVSQDLLIGKAAKLKDTGKLSVAGSVIATDTANLHAYDQTTVRGNVEIGSYRLIELAGIDVHGTLSIQHNATHQTGDQVYVRRSELGGLVLKHNNGAFGDISDNRIATRLQCAQNGFGRFLFERNMVAGKPVTESACAKP
jgi:hypothetical protein